MLFGLNIDIIGMDVKFKGENNSNVPTIKNNKQYLQYK